MTKITFIAREDEDGGYYTGAAEAAIFTQADTLEELRLMIKDAVKCYFDDESDKPKIVHLHISHNEVFAL